MPCHVSWGTEREPGVVFRRGRVQGKQLRTLHSEVCLGCKISAGVHTSVPSVEGKSAKLHPRLPAACAEELTRKVRVPEPGATDAPGDSCRRICNRKLLRFPSLRDRLNEQWYVHRMEYYTANKRESE